MELTKEQIQEIDNYISVCGIKYYDVRAELVDHFASILEERIKKEPSLIFSNAIAEEHRKFSDSGFKKLLDDKEKAVQKRFVKMTLQHLKTFFKLPKVIISIGLFFLFYKFMSFFNDKELFFQILSMLGFGFYFYLGIRVFLQNRKKKDEFLILNRTGLVINIANNTTLWFYILSSYRKETSYLNNNYNSIHLAVFIIMILFFWSMEYVYYKNKKEVLKQYPNTFI